MTLSIEAKKSKHIYDEFFSSSRHMRWETPNDGESAAHELSSAAAAADLGSGQGSGQGSAWGSAWGSGLGFAWGSGLGSTSGKE